MRAVLKSLYSLSTIYSVSARWEYYFSPPFFSLFFNKFHGCNDKNCVTLYTTFHPAREIWEIFINDGTIKREKLFCILLSGVYRQTVINTDGKDATKANEYGYRICICVLSPDGKYTL